MKYTFSKFQKGWLFIIVFLFGILLGMGTILIINKIYETPSSSVTSKSELQEEKNKYILSKDVMATIVWWDQDEGFEVVKNNKDKISTLNPFWYKIQADGSIKKFTGAEDKTILSFARENNIKIIPTITNDCERGNPETVLKSTELTNKNIEAIVQLVETNNYDGINITYECLEDKSLKDSYSKFLSALSNKLHAKDKLLFSAVHAKSSDDGTWEGTYIQDWKSIGESCDKVKIMAYDYSWSTAPAGNIAPLSWIKETLDYAKTVIDPQKIYLGIHFYGYDWIDEQAKDLTYNDVQDLLDKYNPQVKDSLEKEKYFNYTEGDTKHTVYYTDSNVARDRIQLVNEYNVRGIAIWRLGQEDPNNWQVIEEILKK